MKLLFGLLKPINFKHCSGFVNTDFEQVNADWKGALYAGFHICQNEKTEMLQLAKRNSRDSFQRWRPLLIAVISKLFCGN